ncbi:MAG: hypothetical protein HZC48_04665 [Nitrospirae bacterium]|nr:hypothetical protein [Nitrospirota bacterium]
MLKTVKGHYRQGAFELYEKPQIEECDILVTFIENGELIDLKSRGITKEEAQDLRYRLRTFEDDWNAPGMEIYDKV